MRVSVYACVCVCVCLFVMNICKLCLEPRCKHSANKLKNCSALRQNKYLNNNNDNNKSNNHRRRCSLYFLVFFFFFFWFFFLKIYLVKWLWAPSRHVWAWRGVACILKQSDSHCVYATWPSRRQNEKLNHAMEAQSLAKLSQAKPLNIKTARKLYLKVQSRLSPDNWLSLSAHASNFIISKSGYNNDLIRQEQHEWRWPDNVSYILLDIRT